MTFTNKNQNRTDDLFAKLLAGENIGVTRKANSRGETSFDTHTRQLTLPILKGDTPKSVNHMFTGHEVGHALHTPVDGFEQGFKSSGIDKEYQDHYASYLNIVEDARIEKMILNGYPGMRPDFVKGYAHLVKTHPVLSRLAGDVENLSTIDRVNLYCKCGSAMPDLILTEEEEEIVARMKSTVTFDDVIELTNALWKSETNKTQNQPKPEDGDGDGDGEPEDGDGKSKPQSGTGKSKKSDSEDGDDDDGSGDTDDDKDGGDDADGSGDGGDDKDDADGSGDGGDDDDSEIKNPQSAGTGSSLTGRDGFGNGKKQAPAKSETSDALDDAIKGEVDDNAMGWVNATIPKFPKEILDAVRVKNEKVLKDFARVENKSVEKRYATFLKKNRPAISSAINTFNRYKSAEASRRSASADTGRLDTSKLAQYKIRDDIFLKSETVFTGKSHGVYMVVDWSGSMAGDIEATAKQALLMAEFCRRLKIPFSIHAFTSGYNLGVSGQNINSKTSDISISGVRMIEFVTNIGSAAKHVQLAMRTFFQAAWAVNNSKNRNFCPAKYGLGGTPLSQAKTWVGSDIARFQTVSKVDFVNVIFLTDGDGQSARTLGNEGVYYNSAGTAFISSTHTGMQYGNKYGYDEAITREIKKVCGGKLIHFYIDSYYNPGNMKTEFDKNGYDVVYNLTGSHMDNVAANKVFMNEVAAAIAGKPLLAKRKRAKIS